MLASSSNRRLSRATGSGSGSGSGSKTIFIVPLPAHHGNMNVTEIKTRASKAGLNALKVNTVMEAWHLLNTILEEAQALNETGDMRGAYYMCRVVIDHVFSNSKKTKQFVEYFSKSAPGILSRFQALQVEYTITSESLESVLRQNESGSRGAVIQARPTSFFATLTKKFRPALPPPPPPPSGNSSSYRRQVSLPVPTYKPPPPIPQRVKTAPPAPPRKSSATNPASDDSDADDADDFDPFFDPFSAPPPVPGSYSSRTNNNAYQQQQIMRECTICASTLPLSNFPRHRPTKKCKHDRSQICSACLDSYIGVLVNEQGQTQGIKCPVGGCGLVMEYHEIRKAVGRVVFERYDNLLMVQTLQRESNFRWCKGATCGHGQIHDAGDQAPLMTCSVCRFKSCFTHDVPWHSDETCAQYTARIKENKNDRGLKAYLEKMTKMCPKCSQRIEKYDDLSCDHMTCRRPGGCGHEFCWRCLAPFDNIRKDGNHRHQKTCKFYAPPPKKG